MTRPFLPPPPEARYQAITYRAGWSFTGQRCLQRHLKSSDLCKRHREMESKGQHDLPLWAIWAAVILLLSLATIPVTAQWRSREKEANGRGATSSSANDLTPAVSEGGAEPSKPPVRGLPKGEAPDAVIPVADLTRTHGRNAGQTGSQAPAVPLASSSRLTLSHVLGLTAEPGGAYRQTIALPMCGAPGWVKPALRPALGPWRT